MFKRCLLLGTVLIIISSAAACSGEVPPTPETPVIVQDIMSGSEDISDEPVMSPPPDLVQPGQQQTQALTEEKDYLQSEIDALNQKLAGLQWLRGSYIAQNPADLQAKLVECDTKIADINTQLQNLQNRLTRNEKDSNATGENEPEISSDLIPANTESSAISVPTPDQAVPTSLIHWI